MWFIVLGAFLVIALVATIVTVNFFQLWLQAWLSSAYVPFTSLLGMRLRKVRPSTIVLARINAVQYGLDISLDDLEAHYHAGGDVTRAVQAVIAAKKGNFELSYAEATALDLQGEDVLEMVKKAGMLKQTVSVNGEQFDAMAAGGPIEVGALLRVTAVENGVLTVEIVDLPGI